MWFFHAGVLELEIKKAFNQVWDRNVSKNISKKKNLTFLLNCSRHGEVHKD